MPTFTCKRRHIEGRRERGGKEEEELTTSNHRPHGHGIPDGVGAEEGDGVAGLEAILPNQRRAQLRRLGLDLRPIESLVGDGVDIGAQGWPGILTQRRVFLALKSPFPSGEIVRD